jgi:hypothetical protein
MWALLIVLMALAVAPLVFYVSFLFRGIVLSVGWGWFVAEPFALPEINIWHAAGLSCLIGSLTTGAGIRKFQLSKDVLDPKADRMAIAELLLGPWFVLLFLYIIKCIAT